MFSRAFLRDLAERVIVTFAEALAALLILAGTDVLETDWPEALAAAGMAAVIALLKGLAAYKLGDNETGASLLTEAPPRVERGESALVIVLVVVVVVILLFLLFPAIGR